MLKAIAEFFITGISVVVVYLTYCAVAIVSTLLLGFPIAVGIKMITDILSVLFTSTRVSPY